jgi:CPA1 family monovalent cation:H+ antiporter
MRLFDIIAVLVTLTALASYVNHRYVRLHPSVGVMLIALLLSLALVGLGKLGLGVQTASADFLQHVHFGDALLTWMLGFLLFAAALTVDISELRRPPRRPARFDCGHYLRRRLLLDSRSRYNHSWTGAANDPVFTRKIGIMNGGLFFTKWWRIVLPRMKL